MKRLISLLLSLIFVLSLASCGAGSDDEEEVTTREPDWRNKIEYEGFFYVDAKTKLLYALDTGKITLWLNSGNGSVLQEIEYDSTESDVIENFEFEDFNGDGYTDIRAPLTKNDNAVYYNLWLWNDSMITFNYCTLYADVPNPVHVDKQVSSVIDAGIFGVTSRTYEFDKNRNFTLTSVSTEGLDEIAVNVAKALVNADAAKKISTKTIEENNCDVYLATKDGEELAYICASPDSKWYIDVGKVGAYRKVVEEDENFAAGTYAELAFYAERAVLAKNNTEEAKIVSIDNGTIEETKCKIFTFDSGDIIAASDSARCWWSEDGTAFYRINNTTGVVTSDNTFQKS